MTHESLNLTVVLSGGQKTGGGFHQALTNLRMLLTTLPEHFVITIVYSKGTFSRELAELQKQGLTSRATVVALPRRLSTFRDRVLTDDRRIFQLARALLRISGLDVATSVLARFLDTSEADLVYFTSPAPEGAQLQQKPFVWTLWDLCHRDFPEFPEVRTSGKFEAREEINSRALRKASLVVVDSQELIDKAGLYFGVQNEKFVSIPFSPPLSRQIQTPRREDIPPEVRDLAGRYFFYPAQLWTHKNHVRIIEALRLANTQGNNFHAVFAGKDHGAGQAIKREVSALGMESRVHFLGYVDDVAIPALYMNSIGLVMASYFGPTNIPPLEAMLLDTPVIASDIHRNQLGSAALYFNPDDADELSKLMVGISDTKVITHLLSAGRKRLAQIDDRREQGERELTQRLCALSARILRP